MKQLDFALSAAGRGAVNAIRKQPQLLLAMAPAAGGLLILAWAAAAIARAPWTPADGERLVLWLGMGTAAAMSPLPIPWRAGRRMWTAAEDLGPLPVLRPS